MYVRVEPNHIYLSRRNLRALLAKLDEAGSLRTLWILTDDGTMSVTAEDDATHYIGRKPGPMSLTTETTLANQEQN